MAEPLRIWIWNSNTIASHIWTDNTNDLSLNKISTTRLFSSLTGHATSTKMSSKLHANRALARFLLKKFIHEWYIYILLADIGSFGKRSPLGSESSIFCEHCFPNGSQPVPKISKNPSPGLVHSTIQRGSCEAFSTRRLPENSLLPTALQSLRPLKKRPSPSPSSSSSRNPPHECHTPCLFKLGVYTEGHQKCDKVLLQ